MIYQKLEQDKSFFIPVQKQSSFYLFNIALDLSSAEAALFIVQDQKEILIAELSRSNGGMRSISLDLEFLPNQVLVLLSKGGSIHIIGGFKNTSLKLQLLKQMGQKNLNRSQAQNKQDKNKIQAASSHQRDTNDKNLIEPLRRSSRVRAPTKAAPALTVKAAKREKQELRNIASLLGLEEGEQSDDDSFEKDAEGTPSSSSSSSQSDSDSNQQKKKEHAQKSNNSLKMQEEQREQQPVRRSTRTKRAIEPIQNVKSKSAKRQKQQLRNIGKLLNYQIGQEEEDDDSFSQKEQQSSSESESNENGSDGENDKKQKNDEDEEDEEDFEEGQCRKQKTKGSKKENKKVEKNIKRQKQNGDEVMEKQNGLHFSVPTRNPYA